MSLQRSMLGDTETSMLRVMRHTVYLSSCQSNKRQCIIFAVVEWRLRGFILCKASDHPSSLFPWYTFSCSRFLQVLFYSTLMDKQVEFIFWFKYYLGQKYQAPQVRPDRGSNSWPPNHDSSFHVTETPALTTWPLVTSGHTKDIYINVFTVEVML